MLRSGRRTVRRHRRHSKLELLTSRPTGTVCSPSALAGSVSLFVLPPRRVAAANATLAMGQLRTSRTPLTVWFRAMWWVTSQKNGVSALGLKRVSGLVTYQTIWAWLHKPRRTMIRPRRDRLSGHFDVEENVFEWVEGVFAGRQTESTALILFAAQEDGKGIGRIRMQRIPDASARSLVPFVYQRGRRGRC